MDEWNGWFRFVLLVWSMAISALVLYGTLSNGQPAGVELCRTWPACSPDTVEAKRRTRAAR